MEFTPLTRMWERVEVARQDSDTALFMALMYLGEMITKLVAAGLMAAIEDDRDRSRYAFLHDAVRADGIGDWSKSIGELLRGPASQHLNSSARTEQRELTQRCGPGTWQFEAVDLIHACFESVDPSMDPLPARVDAERWLRDFARLRNKTRGHGAPQSHILSSVCPRLEESLRIVSSKYSLFQRDWAYLHRNLSGKYRVTTLGGDGASFDYLKKTSSENVPNGVYVTIGRAVRVELVESNVDATDFYFANGGFNEKQFEMLSYASGDVVKVDAAVYMDPVGPLPASETEGRPNLDVHGNCFGNLPPIQEGYVQRELLEDELLDALRDDRHPIVTLIGRGGIGKTSLAVASVHDLANISIASRFDVILWFSARDLDLLPQGPKRVRPSVLTIRDVAREFASLMEPKRSTEKGFDAERFLAECLTSSPFGPTLLVVDNFETLARPIEFFKWLDTYVRSPNKILITTRQRDFRGDFPIDVPGMSEVEFNRLLDLVSGRLGIAQLITSDYRQELFRESDGHPYVLKMLLSEVATKQKVVPIQRVFADSDELLAALFERTWATLSPAAQRTFLTLSSWRSSVPLLALQAVLLRPSAERVAVQDAVDELERSSFIEVVKSEADDQLFLMTPFVAGLFGRRKLAVSPFKSAIEADTEMLQHFGAGQRVDVQHGLAPRIQRLVKFVAEQAAGDPEALAGFLPMLEFIARGYPRTWLDIAKLHEESTASDRIERAKEAVRSYLEVASGADARPLWRDLARLCQISGDSIGEVQALVEMADLPDTSLRELSNAANRFNSLVRGQKYAFEIDARQVLAKRLLNAMEQRIRQADATDYSRMAWLCLMLDDQSAAIEYTRSGLRQDSGNEYCQNLAIHLGIREPAI